MVRQPLAVFSSPTLVRGVQMEAFYGVSGKLCLDVPSFEPSNMYMMLFYSRGCYKPNVCSKSNFASLSQLHPPESMLAHIGSGSTLAQPTGRFLAGLGPTPSSSRVFLRFRRRGPSLSGERGVTTLETWRERALEPRLSGGKAWSRWKRRRDGCV